MAKINRNSYLSTSTLNEIEIDYTKFTYWSCPDQIVIDEEEQDIVYYVVAGDRLDRLANTYYRDSRLWWVIAAANQMSDPIVQLIVGKKIIIPNPKTVLQKYTL